MKPVSVGASFAAVLLRYPFHSIQPLNLVTRGYWAMESQVLRVSSGWLRDPKTF